MLDFWLLGRWLGVCWTNNATRMLTKGFMEGTVDVWVLTGGIRGTRIGVNVFDEMTRDWHSSIGNCRWCWLMILLDWRLTSWVVECWPRVYDGRDFFFWELTGILLGPDELIPGLDLFDLYVTSYQRLLVASGSTRKYQKFAQGRPRDISVGLGADRPVLVLLSVPYWLDLSSCLFCTSAKYLAVLIGWVLQNFTSIVLWLGEAQIVS